MQNIEEVYLEHSKLVYKYLFCLTHNNELAEELTQETFVCAIKEINNFKGNAKLSTWLCQIAKNLWYKELRKIKKAKIIPIDEIGVNIKNEEDIETKIIQNNEKEILYKMIEKLPNELREIIYLRIVGEFSFKQIGEILGKNENWARVTFYRGKEKLKEGEYNEKE